MGIYYDMANSRKTVLLLNGILSLCLHCGGTVPLADGTWLSSSRGTWTVNSTTIAGYSSSLNAAEPTSALTYISNSGTLYLFSTTTEVFGVSVTFYTCLDFRISAATVPLFYIVTVFNSSVSDTFTGASSEACTNTGYQTVDNTNVLVQQGSETGFTSVLPNVIRGEYSVNFTSVSGVTSDGVTLDACNDTTVMRFNSSGGVQNVGFSSDGYLTSLYTTVSGGITYLYTYNNDSSVDGSTTYRLVCWAILSASFGASASAYPGTCTADQTATFTPTGGQLFSLTSSFTCPSTDDSSDSDNTVIIIIVVVCVIVVVIIIVIVIIVIYCMIKRKKEKKQQAAEEDDLKKSIRTRDVSVTTSVTSEDSVCLPWIGRGTKTASTSTSTTDLNSVSFYLPLKYTKRPGDVAKGAPATKRPRSPKLHRSKTTLSAVSETNTDKSNNSSKPVRFIPYVGVVKKDTQTKPVIDTHWSNGVHNNSKITKPKESNTNSIKITDELTRAKTFHDFVKEFDEKNKFPSNKNNTIQTENKTTRSVAIGNVTETDDTNTPRRGILKVRSQEELDQIQVPDETKDEQNDTVKDGLKRVYFKRSRTLPGIHYTSPYAMTSEQRDYFSKRRQWVTMQHNHEQAKQHWLKEKKSQESKKAYQDWIKCKSIEAGQTRATFKRTYSQTS